MFDIHIYRKMKNSFDIHSFIGSYFNCQHIYFCQTCFQHMICMCKMYEFMNEQITPFSLLIHCMLKLWCMHNGSTPLENFLFEKAINLWSTTNSWCCVDFWSQVLLSKWQLGFTFQDPLCWDTFIIHNVQCTIIINFFFPSSKTHESFLTFFGCHVFLGLVS